MRLVAGVLAAALTVWVAWMMGWPGGGSDNLSSSTKPTFKITQPRDRFGPDAAFLQLNAMITSSQKLSPPVDGRIVVLGKGSAQLVGQPQLRSRSGGSYELRILAKAPRTGESAFVDLTLTYGIGRKEFSEPAGVYKWTRPEKRIEVAADIVEKPKPEAPVLPPELAKFEVFGVKPFSGRVK